MIEQLLDSFVQTMLSTLSSFGYFGIFILMTIESTIIPFPAEIILIPAGALIADNKLNFYLVLIVAIVGSILGALINYALAFLLGRTLINKLTHKYGKILFINEKSLIKTEKYFEKHGSITTFVGRLIPGIRSFISLPAGFAKMKLVPFCIYTGLGAGIWSAILITIGYLAGTNKEIIKMYLTPLTYIIIIIAIIVSAFYISKNYGKGYPTPKHSNLKSQGL